MRNSQIPKEESLFNVANVFEMYQVLKVICPGISFGNAQRIMINCGKAKDLESLVGHPSFRTITGRYNKKVGNLPKTKVGE